MGLRFFLSLRLGILFLKKGLIEYGVVFLIEKLLCNSGELLIFGRRSPKILRGCGLNICVMGKVDEKLVKVARFIGIRYYPETGHYYDDEGAFVGVKVIYDTSWDWLVPVMQKAYSMRVDLRSDQQWRLGMIVKNYQLAVVNDEIAVAFHYVYDAVALFSEDMN